MLHMKKIMFIGVLSVGSLAGTAMANDFFNTRPAANTSAQTTQNTAATTMNYSRWLQTYQQQQQKYVVQYQLTPGDYGVQLPEHHKTGGLLPQGGQ